MLPAVAAICVAVSRPAAPYDGDPPALRVPRPALPAIATSARGFAPPGWRVEREVTGDLDRDGRRDLAVILRGADPDCLVRTGAPSGTMDTNPRMVLVALGTRAGFRLHVANATIIPRIDDPYMDDPLNLDAFAIRGEVLRLGLGYWRSMGGWTTYTSTLAFRWNGRRFGLIGFDRESLQRNSRGTEALSVNFASGRARVVKGSMQDDVDGVTHWRRIDQRQAPTLETMGNGLTFDPKLVRDSKVIRSG